MAAMLVEAYIPDFSIQKVAHPTQVQRQVWNRLEIDLNLDVQTPEYFAFKVKDFDSPRMKELLDLNLRLDHHGWHYALKFRPSSQSPKAAQQGRTVVERPQSGASARSSSAAGRPTAARREHSRTRQAAKWPPSAAQQSKTMICSFFQEGRCKNGESCSFLHEAPKKVGEKESRNRHFMDGWKQPDWKDWDKDKKAESRNSHFTDGRKQGDWKDWEDKKAEVDCRDGRLCSRDNCHFAHRNGREMDEMPVDVTAREMISVLPRSEKLFRELREARFAHLRLVRDASERSQSLLLESLEAMSEGARQEKVAKAKVVEAKSKELQLQLENFDEAALTCMGQLLSLQKLQKDDSDSSSAEQDSSDGQSKHAIPEKILHLRRELYRLRGVMPALAARAEIEQQLAKHKNLVVQGATGSGKSTQLPQYLAECSQGERIICTQPRKVAATSLAKRVAEEWAAGKESPEVGDQVGYHVGGSRKIRPWTKIVYMTEEILLQQLMREGVDFLTGVHAIILDEAHERSVRLDLLLGWLCDLQRRAKPNLRLVVTSATLDKDLFSKYLEHCPVVMIPGRMFPVKNVYFPTPDTISVQEYARAKVKDLHEETDIEEGDILAFLPSQQDVESSRKLLQTSLEKSEKPFEVFALHGGQDPEEQAEVFKKLTGCRKIIFATNVAETSVTIDGVRLVVDSGVEKQLIFEAKRNLSSLKEVPISKSSAQQRRGRAGRTAPGTCVRLYSQDEFEVMRETQLPEVLSKPVSLTLLTLLRMGLDPSRFRWLDAPDKEAEAIAWSTLKFLGAVDEEKSFMRRMGLGRPQLKLTAFGKLAAELQIDPAWAKVLHVGHSLGMLRAAGDLVGVLSVQSILFKKPQEDERKKVNEAQQDFFSVDGDVVMAFNVYRQWSAILNEDSDAKWQNRQEAYEFCKKHYFSPKAMELAKASSRDLVQQCCTSLKIDKEELGRKSDEISAADLMHLVTAGSFLNIGVLCRGVGTAASGHYHLIDVHGQAEKATVVGAIFPASTLVRGNAEAPKFLCFSQILETSRTFLTGVTPLAAKSDADLVGFLRGFSSNVAKVVESKLPSISSAQVEVKDFSTRMLVGSKARQYRLDVQDLFDCTFYADLKQGSIQCWCAPGRANPLQQHLIQHRDRLLQDDLNEVEEDLLAGHTRPVYGRGGTVAMILYPGELLSVNIIGLPKETKEVALKHSLERYGPVRVIQTSTMAQTGDLFCQATFMKKEHAKLALDRYRTDCKFAVNVVPGKVQPGQRAPAETGYLTLTWNCPRNDDLSETGELMLSVAALGSLVPLKETQPEMQTFFRERKVEGETVAQAGLQVIYETIDQLQLAYKEWKQPGPGQLDVPSDMLSSLRCDITFQAVVSVHKAIAEYFNFQCSAGKSCRYSDCKKWHEGKRFACKDGKDCCGYKGKGKGQTCTYLHPYSWYRVPEPAEVENPLLDACHACDARGAKLSVVTKGQTTSFRIQHSRFEQLQAARAEFLTALMCDVFVHPHKDQLFTKPGIAKMQKMGKSVHWDKHLRCIRIFGAPAHRQDIQDRLKQLCQELESLERHCVTLDRNKAKEWGSELETYLRHHLKLEHNINKKTCQMEYWVDMKKEAQKIEVLQGVLATRKWERRRAPLSEGKCSLCSDDLDPDSYQFQACRHRFCTSCLRGEFSDPDRAPFPIRCPFESEGGKCDEPIVWKDIVGLVNSEVLSRIKNIAIDSYIRENPGDAVYCPHPACNHVLQPVTQPDERNAGGSLTGFCEVCNTGYCLACSEDAKIPVPMHQGKNCSEARQAGNPDIKKHRDAISQILTLKCPRCACAFLDYDGCSAVSCDACGCGFCAKCFKDCGRDAHQHASECRGPGIPGVQPVSTNVYQSMAEFDRLNLEVAKQRILDYLHYKVPRNLRGEVIKACEVDFRGRPGGDILIS